jgi:hypothetical protein
MHSSLWLGSQQHSQATGKAVNCYTCRYRLYGVLLREPTDFHDVNEPGG